MMRKINSTIGSGAKRVQGIALIQVLIISIILTMLGIYINQTVRSQISVVSLMKNSFGLNLALEIVEADLLHALLTKARYKNSNSENILVQKWNFYGEPFLIDDNTVITIQDLSGLLNLNLLNNTIAANFFELNELSDDKVRTFLDSLADWKDKDDLKRLNGAESHYYQNAQQPGPRNAYLQTISEVESIKNGHLLNYKQWSQFFTSEIIPNFNPLNAPNAILKAYLNNAASYEEVLQLRNSGMLTKLSFYQATSIDEGEYITFATSGLLKVTLLVKGQNNKLSKEFVVDLRPGSQTRPIVISHITWNQV